MVDYVKLFNSIMTDDKKLFNAIMTGSKLLDGVELCAVLQFPGNLYSCKVEIWEGTSYKRFYMHNVNGEVELFSFDLCRNLDEKEINDTLIKNASKQQTVLLSSIVNIEKEIRRRMHAVEDLISHNRDITLNGKVYTLLGDTAEVMISYDMDDTIPLSEVVSKIFDLTNEL